MAKNLDISVLLDFYGDMLTPKQHEVADYYFNDDLSLAEIAEHSGITRQGVRDSIKRAENQLLDYEENLGLYAKFVKIQNGLDEITAHASELLEMHSHLNQNAEAIEKTQRIIDIASRLNE